MGRLKQLLPFGDSTIIENCINNLLAAQIDELIVVPLPHWTGSRVCLHLMSMVSLVDRDLAVYALKAGYGVRGATIGSQGNQAALFRDEMTRFFHRTLLA